MNVRVLSDPAAIPAQSVLAIPYHEGDSPDSVAGTAGSRAVQISDALERGQGIGKRYEMTLLLLEQSGAPVLIAGAGARTEWTALDAARWAGAVARYLTARGYTSVALADPGTLSTEEFARAAAEGALDGAYELGIKKTEGRVQRRLQEVILLSPGDGSAVEDAARRGEIVGESRNLARDLINLPPNEINPVSLAERARAVAGEFGLRFQALDEHDMAERGMGALLGVAAGSFQSPRLIVLEYGEESSSIKLALVGKGLTFDSGGLSLKTAEGMETMKSDMSGAAAVIAGMAAIARLSPGNISVTGYVGAAENMPGGGAMRPGDVLTAMNGNTIEVLNTDAEGRLVLADVLAFAASRGATHIVDFATLTGAAMISLGDAASLATGRPQEWVDEVVRAADDGMDRAWPMPLYPEYLEAMRSDLADLKNTGGRGGGALKAAAFLGEFVGDARWAHLDIAGTAFAREEKPYRPAGATGRGVGLITALARMGERS